MFLLIFVNNAGYQKKNNKIQEQKAVAKLKGFLGDFSPFHFFFPLTSGYNMQEVILSRQQSVTTAWNFSIILSQKKKKSARGSNISQYLVTLENNGIV